MMQKLSTNNLVAQTNKMIEGRYALSRNEKLLLDAMVSLIKPKDQEFPDFCVTLDELCEILEIDRTTAVREFKTASKKLLKRVIEIESKEHGWTAFQWVSNATVSDGLFMLRFHENLKPYLLELKKEGNFTQHRLGNVTGFRSIYSIRIYQLLKEYHGKKIYKFEFTLSDFKRMVLGQNFKSYAVFKNFRRRVLDIAQKELSKQDEKTGYYKSDLSFDLETKRAGRKISHLVFTIKTQQTQATPSTQAKPQRTENDHNTPQIIRDYEAIGIMRKMVQPYLDQRGEQALQYTLNKFHDDKENGKITKSEQGYLAYLLRVNAGQETTQDKERQQKEVNEKRLKEKEAQEQALKEQFTQARETALAHFFDTVGDEEREYMLLDFEASALFKEQIKARPMFFSLYNTPEGMNDRDIRYWFNSFIIDKYLETTLNDFSAWKKKNATLK